MLKTKARAHAPSHVTAVGERFRLATRRHQNGEFQQAEELYRDVLAAAPGHVGAMNLLGVVMLQTGRLSNGLGWIDKALTLRPDDVDALNNRGNALIELKRYEEAVASFDRALALRPDFPEALNNRANALRQLERYEQALANYDKALALKPDYADALTSRAAALWSVGRWEEALASSEKALTIKPVYPEALAVRSAALRDLGRLPQALASYDLALSLRPDYAAWLANFGAPPTSHNGLNEPRVLHNTAAPLNPDLAGLIFNRSLVQLLAGDLAAGWRSYECRWDARDASPRKLNACYPVWRGENVSGRRIIVYHEQGFGDIIQFARYLPRLAEAGAEVTLFAPPSLHKLIATVDDSVVVTDGHPAGETFDYQCALASLPLAFATTLQTIPAKTPYLRAEPERVQKWRARLGAAGFRIGVAWQGSKAGKCDLGRSFALANFLGVSLIPDVRLISLQKNDGTEQLANLPAGMRVETLGEDFDAGGDAFLDTAAVMDSLHLVISCDTSIAHLAGALGRNAWVALKRVPDWRWMLDRSDCPWYPTMRLFRQKTRDDWRDPFAEIETALREQIPRATPQPTAG